MKQHITKQSVAVIGTLLFFAATAMLSCTARIHIETDPADERLVVYGYITSDTTSHSIRITRSAPYFSNNPAEGISNAVVFLSRGDEIIPLEESSSLAGLYLTASDVYGIEGETYKLHIEVDFDEDGEMELFEASAYMPYTSDLDSIQLADSKLFGNMIEVKLYGKVPPNEVNYFSFRASVNDRILNDSLKGMFIIGAEHISQTEFLGLSCFFIDQDDENEKIVPGDTVKLRVDVLTKEYADFLDNAQEEISGNMPIFDGPPANVQTNIIPLFNPAGYGVSGFFSAYSGKEAYKIYK